MKPKPKQTTAGLADMLIATWDRKFFSGYQTTEYQAWLAVARKVRRLVREARK
jgi:hypothetical protein